MHNEKICQFLEPSSDCQIEKILEICWFCDSDNSKNSPNFIILKIVHYWQIHEVIKFSKFDNIENYQNSKNFQFGKLSYYLSVRIL